jgi:hypothetical protein
LEYALRTRESIEATDRDSELILDKRLFEKINVLLDESTIVDICRCIRDYEFIDVE